jgi:hypothetical protein
MNRIKHEAFNGVPYNRQRQCKGKFSLATANTITEMSVYRNANFGKSSGKLNHHTCNDGKRRLVAALYMKMAVCPSELDSFQALTLKKFCVYSNRIDALFIFSLLN